MMLTLLSSDIFLETIRAFIVLLLVVYLWRKGRGSFALKRRGWNTIIAGFVLLLFGCILDITDEIGGLEKYILIGDTPAQAFLEKVVGFLGGFSLLSYGLTRWIPFVQNLSDEVEKNTSEMKMALSLAEESSEMKAVFLANMSHEIRTPMNGIIGTTQLILAENLSPAVQRYAETTLRSANNLLLLTNDILDFSKIEAGRLDLEEIDFDIQTLIREILETLSPQFHEKGIELILRFDEKIPKIIIGDPGRIRQIINNLLSNAIKFTSKGHVLLDVSAGNGDENLPQIIIEIEDTGIGIPDDKQDSIFQQFNQGDKSTTRIFGGTGLGLAICKHLSNLMGGDVNLRSQVGQGTIFSVSLPLKRSEKNEKKEITYDSDIIQKSKILIVDDNLIAGDIIAEQLRSEGANTSGVLSGKQALIELKMAAQLGKPYDLAIIDYHMPEMRGRDLVRIIQSDPNLSEIVMIMAIPLPLLSEAQDITEMGVEGYFTKPIFPREVAGFVSTVMKARRNGEENSLLTPCGSSDHVIQKDVLINFKDKHILLVEDNEVNKMIASEILKGWDCTISTAENGLEALEKFNQEIFDLILMDCQMPIMDGMEASTKIREIEATGKKRRTPIVAFTANAMKRDQIECIAAGMDDFISKPVEVGILHEKFSKWLNMTPKIQLRKNVTVAAP